MARPTPTSPIAASASPAAKRRISPKRRARSISVASRCGKIWSRRVSMIEGLELLISALSRTSHLARLICPRLGHAPSSSEPPLFGGHDGNKVANHHTRSEHAAASDKIATVADLTAQISLDYHRRVPSKGIASRFCRTSTETLLQQLHAPRSHISDITPIITT